MYFVLGSLENLMVCFDFSVLLQICIDDGICLSLISLKFLSKTYGIISFSSIIELNTVFKAIFQITLYCIN